MKGVGAIAPALFLLCSVCRLGSEMPMSSLNRQSVIDR
jgi:hypothetical protein